MRPHRASVGPALSNLPPDEKGPKSIEVQSSLLGLSHRLNDRGKRIEILPYQTDHEVVVVPVETATCEANVMRVIRGAVLHADLTVLGQNRALLLGRQLREPAAASQRIPDRPRPIWIGKSAQRAL